MKYTEALAFLLVNGLLLTSALPQGGYGGQTSRPSAPYGSSSGTAAPAGACCGGASSSGASYAQSSGQELQGSAASFGNDAFASRPSNQQQTFGSFGGGGGGSGGSQGGNLNVECQRQEVSPGKFKFVCEGVNKDAISLRSEHILWLTGAGGQQQVVDIEIPNYKIEELIKAGFKVGPDQGSQINVLLRKPEQSYDAQVEDVPSVGSNPKVNLQYEPVQKTVVHFPNDKAYSPLQGPILPPLAGGRSRRQETKQFSKPYGQQQIVAQQVQQVQQPLAQRH